MQTAVSLLTMLAVCSGLARCSAPEPQARAGRASAATPSDGVPETDIAEAARTFLAGLPAELRAQASFPFESPARTDWHFVPRAFHGVELGRLDVGQRGLAIAMLRAACSERGVAKAEAIMALDGILRDIEQGRGQRRDPLAYAVAVFGMPGAEPWGWRLEGHHLSLSFTGAAGLTAVTPAFLGANPARIPSGPHVGTRVLAAEEDLGFELLASLDESQRRQAVLGASAPADIVAVPGRDAATVDSVGLPASAMDSSQRAILWRLVREFAGNLRSELAAREIARIREAGDDNVRFAWMGGTRLGDAHYFRVSGPTFVIELDNVQDGANHVHAVWRDRARDFGADLLRTHRDAAHHIDISSTAPTASTK